jgi:acyl-CoA synthetase (AMP-forming)/AMP-acid ligase II
VGSAPLPVELWSDITKWSRAEVVNCYGITETANWISGASFRADDLTGGFVGKPWGGVAAVLDEDGKIRSSGDGEIVVQTPALMSGYMGRPDLTAAVMRSGWYCTGDRGSVDHDGQIRLSGRIKDEINRAGFKVQPAEIDALLEAHPAVAEACVFGISDSVSGEIVAAAVSSAPDEEVDIERLRNWCATRLRRAAIPERWFVVDKLPRSERGKINRDAVRRALVGD